MGAKLSRVTLALCLVAVTFVGCPVWASAPRGTKPRASATVRSKTRTTTKAKPVAVIEAYYPFNTSHRFIIEYLQAVQKANPKTIKLTIYDTQTEEGRAKVAKTDLSCAGVFVNGRTRHAIVEGGKKRDVDFRQRMEVFWTHKDFETVLGQLLKATGKSFVAPRWEKRWSDAASYKTEKGKQSSEQPKAPASK